YTDTAFQDGDFLVFGKETAGLPKELLQKNADRAIRIPMGESQRSLNLSNSVAIVLYEALRQNNFLDLI
ncbi:MAG: tRNA (uridine(34)/cytosine(34)/5-carboxymethylaminomethyluridine(34)-2'-O)-methyltransferase TrmL, partial [Firmicutes bacterium]|nr:tRNA (uridine(34)/cytosine(34)/5-carboxymethylaminomethyluridine(34)-2'-O)-methyltransferase TrmL [Bacillota bacterium]